MRQFIDGGWKQLKTMIVLRGFLNLVVTRIVIKDNLEMSWERQWLSKSRRSGWEDILIRYEETKINLGSKRLTVFAINKVET